MYISLTQITLILNGSKLNITVKLMSHQTPNLAETSLWSTQGFEFKFWRGFSWATKNPGVCIQGLISSLVTSCDKLYLFVVE